MCRQTGAYTFGTSTVSKRWARRRAQHLFFPVLKRKLEDRVGQDVRVLVAIAVCENLEAVQLGRDCHSSPLQCRPKAVY
jgi:hypothetical protein